MRKAAGTAAFPVFGQNGTRRAVEIFQIGKSMKINGKKAKKQLTKRGREFRIILGNLCQM